MKIGREQIYGYKHRYLEGNLTTRTLRKITPIGSPLGPMTSITVGFLSLFILVGINSFLWTISQIQFKKKEVGNPMNKACCYCTGVMFAWQVSILACRGQHWIRPLMSFLPQWPICLNLPVLLQQANRESFLVRLKLIFLCSSTKSGQCFQE